MYSLDRLEKPEVQWLLFHSLDQIVVCLELEKEKKKKELALCFDWGSFEITYKKPKQFEEPNLTDTVIQRSKLTECVHE